MLKKLPKFFRNFYFIVGVVALIWMLFFNSTDLVTQWQRGRKLSTLKKQRQYYAEKIKEVHQEREELLTDYSQLEKFAREKYFMKRPDEDLYILVPEEEK